MAAVALALLSGPGLSAERVADLYRGQVVVTGQENLAERARGIRAALGDVLVKVSGDASLASHPDLPRVADRAEGLVAALFYEDRKKGIQISDEQGTRDRSYVLTVDFDAGAINRALAELGSKPWDPKRPKLLILMAVQDTVGSYILGLDSERGFGQRETFLSIARRRGLPLALPRMDASERAELDVSYSHSGRDALFARWRDRYGADGLLRASMRLTPGGSWDTFWELLYEAADRSVPKPRAFANHWSSEQQTFDEAIAAGLGRAANALADRDP